METGDEGVGNPRPTPWVPALPWEKVTHPQGQREEGERTTGTALPCSPRTHRVSFPSHLWPGAGRLTVCGGLQAHGPFVSLSVRYRLWETGNIRETRQTGRGKRPGCQAGWRGGGRGSPQPPLVCAHTPLPTAPAIHALAHVVCLALPLAGVKVGLGPGGGPEDGVADGLWGRMQSFYSASISCLGSCPSSTVG